MIVSVFIVCVVERYPILEIRRKLHEADRCKKTENESHAWLHGRYHVMQRPCVCDFRASLFCFRMLAKV
jgi:hypothetical protein